MTPIQNMQQVYAVRWQASMVFIVPLIFVLVTVIVVIVLILVFVLIMPMPVVVVVRRGVAVWMIRAVVVMALVVVLGARRRHCRDVARNEQRRDQPVKQA